MALGSLALGALYYNALSDIPVYEVAALGVGSAALLTTVRHSLVEMPYSLAILTDLGLWSPYIVSLPTSTYPLSVILILAFSFALTPSIKALRQLEHRLLEGEELKDPQSDIATRIYKAAQKTGGISSLANLFQEINEPSLGKPVTFKDCGRALRDLVDIGEAVKLSAEGNVYLFPGITALNDPLTRHIIELAAGTGSVTVEELILKLNLTPEIAQNALNRLEQFGIAVSQVEDGTRFYTVKGLAKHYTYTERSPKFTREDKSIA